MPATKHAVYANTSARNGERLTFRVGLPVDWNTAQDRWNRLDKRRASRTIHVRNMRRTYRVDSLEVRAVDYNGRGLGSDRHSLAFPVPYRAAKLAR